MVKQEKSMLSKNEKLVYGLLWTTGVLIYDTDMQHGDGRVYWPFHPVFLNSVAAPFVFSEFYRLLKKLEKAGYDDFKIAKLLYSPTKVATYQYLWSCTERFLPGYKEVLPRYKKVWLLKKFAKLLNIMRNGEPFCENFSNLAWSKPKLATIEKEKFLQKKRNEKFFKLLSELEMSLVFYSELLNYYFLDLSRFYHGPYFMNNKQVFVKEFLNLKETERYDFLKDFPFDNFQEIGIYPKDIKIEIFFMGHTHISKPFPEAIEKTILRLDGTEIQNARSLEKTLKGVKNCHLALAKLIKENERDQDFLIRNGIDALLYHLKPLYEALGEDWKRVLPEAYSFADKNRKKVKIPPPWGDWDVFKATKYLFKQQWRVINEKPAGKKEIAFMKKNEKLSKDIYKKEPSGTKSYALVKALSSRSLQTQKRR